MELDDEAFVAMLAVTPLATLNKLAKETMSDEEVLKWCGRLRAIRPLIRMCRLRWSKNSINIQSLTVNAASSF